MESTSPSTTKWWLQGKVGKRSTGQQWPFNKREILMPVNKGERPLTKKEIKEYFEQMRMFRDNIWLAEAFSGLQR